MRLRLVLVLLALASVAGAEEVRLATPGREGWSAKTFPRVTRHTLYAPLEEPGVEGVRAESDCAASALVLALEGIGLEGTPVLRWRWRVMLPLKHAQERTKSGDDFAARIYVMFPLETERTSLVARLRHRALERLAGEKLPARALNYVVSSREPAGARWDNPYRSNSKMISMGPPEPGVWREVKADLLADYIALFGAPPPPPLGLAIMTDSDDTCQKARADFADFRLGSR
jgi:hypothetical protein